MKKILNKSYRKKLIPICLMLLVALNCMGFSLLINNFVVVNDSFENENYNDNYLRSQGIVKDFYSQEWLTNGNFTGTTDPWTNVTSGDLTDINATSSPNAANFEVIGEVFEKQVILDSAHQGDWNKFNKTALSMDPNVDYGIDDDGAYCSHDWNEGGGGQPYNTPRIHWKTNVSMGVDMSDYEITNVSLRAVINATVSQNVDVPGDTYSTYPSTSQPIGSQHVIYDWAQFYVEVSDLDVSELNTYRIAFNQTVELGSELSSNYTMQKNIETKTEQAIKGSLDNIFEVDDGHDNFTLVLGIYIYCEDNYQGNDRDTWDDLRFKYVNLTFTYQKRIDAGSYVQWNQTGNKISGDDVDIENATLNFKYKINETQWPVESPNSEIRVLINDRMHTETVKMNTANETFQYIKDGGFDVTQLILTDINITVAIRLYIADTFRLNRTINITIDEVTLNITYYISTIETATYYDLFLEEENKTLTRSTLVALGEQVNVTMKYYNDSDDSFIPNANVSISYSAETFDLDYDSMLEQYNITIDTTDFLIGDNFLFITAHKKYFEQQYIIIDIVIREKDAIITNVHLNQTAQEFITFPYGELLNITAKYEEQLSGDYIGGATVELLNGTDVLGTFDEQPSLEFYNLTVNSSDLGAKASSFTIYAKLENYTSAFKSIVTLIQRETIIELKINTTILAEYDTYELQVNESLEISVKYRDEHTGDHIDDATVTISGATDDDNLTEYIGPEEYNITLSSVNFTKGYNFMTIIAQKENTMPQSISFSINLIERKTGIQLFVNSSDITSNKTYIIQIGDTINIIVNYTDDYDGSFIDSATVDLTLDGTPSPLTEYSNYYQITLTWENFTSAINFLTVSAEKQNYQPQPLDFRIDVIKRQVKYAIYINDVDRTVEKTVEVPIGVIINISFAYLDLLTDEHVGTATVQLIGADASWSFVESAGQKRYTLSIDTEELELGVKFLTLLAEKTNYQPVSELLKITVRQIRTNITTLSGEEVFSIRAGTSIFLQIKLLDLDFNTTILNATVRYAWQEGEGVLIDDDNDGVYVVWINNIPAGSFIITITASTAEGKYLFESKKITVSSIIPPEEATLIWILLISAIIGFGALSTYFIYYQRVLRHPIQIRKLRKFKRSLKKDKEPSVEVYTQEYAFNEAYNSELGSTAKFVKPVPIGKVPTTVKAQRALEYKEMQKKKALEEKAKKTKPKPPKEKPKVEEPKEELKKEIKEKVEKKPKAEPKAKPKEKPKKTPEKKTNVKAKAKVKTKEAPKPKESVMDELKEKFKEKPKKPPASKSKGTKSTTKKK